MKLFGPIVLGILAGCTQDPMVGLWNGVSGFQNDEHFALPIEGGEDINDPFEIHLRIDFFRQGNGIFTQLLLDEASGPFETTSRFDGVRLNRGAWIVEPGAAGWHWSLVCDVQGDSLDCLGEDTILDSVGLLFERATEEDWTEI